MIFSNQQTTRSLWYIVQWLSKESISAQICKYMCLSYTNKRKALKTMQCYLYRYAIIGKPVSITLENVKDVISTDFSPYLNLKHQRLSHLLPIVLEIKSIIVIVFYIDCILVVPLA